MITNAPITNAVHLVSSQMEISGPSVRYRLRYTVDYNVNFMPVSIETMAAHCKEGLALKTPDVHMSMLDVDYIDNAIDIQAETYGTLEKPENISDTVLTSLNGLVNAFGIEAEGWTLEESIQTGYRKQLVYKRGGIIVDRGSLVY